MNSTNHKLEHGLQDNIFQAMSKPEFYPHPVSRIAQRETHISKVFLTGNFVYKIKKAVKFEFLDYSTLENRQFFCQREIELNRRLATDVYLDVVPITYEKNRFYLNGPGRPVEYAVKMRQLSDACSMLQLLRQKRVDAIAVGNLAHRLSEFYLSTPSDPNILFYGTLAAIRRNCEENFKELTEANSKILDEQQIRIVQAATRAFLLRRSALFEDRVQNGKIRDCHGDLRCGHIYFDEGIQIVDCIEFNDRFRYSDVTCDLAYLIMDLEFEGFSKTAHDLIKEYVRYSLDSDIYILLDFYKSYRAMVKSKISFIAMQGMQRNDYFRKRLVREARKYLSLAYRYAIRFTRPTVWVVCGLPASGKSTIAERLSHILHIDVLQSDQIRKRLFGLKLDLTVDVPFGEGIYSPGATALTYGKLLIQAQEAIEKGRSIILDATFSREHQRREALHLARDMDANIHFFECIAPVERLEARLKTRDLGSPISDARIHHFKDMIDRFEPMDDIRQELHVRVNTENPIEHSIQQILAHDYYLPSGLEMNNESCSNQI